MKILISTDNYLPRWDGISRFLSEIVPRLSGHEITVIAPDFGLLQDSGCKVIRMPLSKTKIGDFTLAKPDSRKIRKEVASCDLVFNQTIGPIGLRTIKQAHRKGKVVVSFIHSIEWELATRAMGADLFKPALFLYAKRFVRKAYKKVDVLVFPSQGIADLFDWHNFGSRYRIIHLGVDTKKFVPAKDKSEAKKNLGIDPGSFVVGYHGRLGREKNLETLLRAYLMFKKKNPKAVLLVVGDGVESIKRKLASVQGVILPGMTSNVVPYLQAMDAYCLPSMTETTSLTTLEAMSCAVPVVVTRVGFVKDYIRHRKTGLFFRVKDSYDLARQLEILASDASLGAALSSNGREFVEKEFDWDITAKRLLELFDELSVDVSERKIRP